MTKKNIFIIAGSAVALAAAIGLSAFILLRPVKTQYQYVSAEKRHLSETVRASGQIKPAQAVDLSFELGGRIKAVNVKAGDAVKSGDVLVELDNSAQIAQVAQAQAMLNQKIAGASKQQVAIYQATVDAARADLAKSKADTASQLDAVQAAYDVAQNNLKMASGGADSQVVGQAYQTSVTVLQSSLPVFDSALNQADQILGVDNGANNLSFKSALSALDSTKLSDAQNLYRTTKQQIEDTRASVAPLVVDSPHATVDQALKSVQDTLNQTNQMLAAVSDVLDATVSGSILPQETLSNMKFAIQTMRGTVVTESNAIVAAQQGTVNAANGLNAYTIAFNKAKLDLDTVQASVSSTILIKQAALEQAQANLDNVSAPARQTDLAPLQAALNAAEAAYSKTQLKAPFDGVVSKQSGSIGDLITSGMSVASVINDKTLQVDVYVSETDVSKIKVGNQATVTVDAYGADTGFAAAVVKIESGATQISGSSAYKVTLQFNQPDDRLKTGMTADASIVTQDKADAVAIPERSLIQRQGAYFVLVRNGQAAPEERKVQVGIKSADGWQEIISGINPGDQAVDF